MKVWNNYPFDLVECEFRDAQGPYSFQWLWGGRALRMTCDTRIDDPEVESIFWANAFLDELPEATQ